MSTSAPRVNSVNALNPKAPRAFFRALSEADGVCRDLADLEQLRAENAGLRARIAELQQEVGEKDAEIRRLNRKGQGW